ncbi:exodeoxyribonuclease VII small subunit [Bacillus canaveralius]|uniref:Exodeoxyribonuclease 7 small subunit n=1 Tax=Bacillus canaveralius TaxID=1403243 RepID=A0A2N5GRC7_9BACI|nr:MULTISPECIES: exodeoxyribonuclease VII small subunit [Bacillus]PLR84491.1 exodeoxyribonuclease VII small subunit [Bacillus sp. V33-4]PLR86005.1 exodeoxyribonuclease VII small subunit [Bacillus canaveralius]PLS00124.1 exodeoxyribonuclease VII small subunit [Bacillus canaveralius]RSK53372.1 exodeoxyribonuclease VII small subunit [Bacillus canaveralius]
MAAEKQLTFEEAMEKLEVIVDRLEEGDVPLEEAISIYKEGMELSKLCHDKLKSVEEQLTQVLTEEGKTEPFSIKEEE